MQNVNIAPTKFADFADHAAALERTGYFTEAAFHWEVAAQNARRPENRHWAECRSMFCSLWSRRYEAGKAA